MLGMNEKLRKREEDGRPIRVGIVGAGQMGSGMVSQMMLMKGMRPSVVVDIRIENARNAYLHAKVPEDRIVVATNAREAGRAIEQDNYVISEDAGILASTDLLDAVVDATGVPEIGAMVAMNGILNGKHVVMLNVETDIVIGPWLKRMAESAGVIYTGSAGDEPGAVKEMYDFADALGLEIRVIGKGKNNAINLEANPDNVREEANRRGISPKMLTAFKDGT
ncbi:MAG: NAD(P)-dependent oxidoreductase, partial [Spirochaetota bacterium]